jgi:hypothetical protein
MRIWSLHPRYLDTKGLVALWRETLLAKHVLEGKTKGYRHHPQLIRFKNVSRPLDAINQYLKAVYNEALNRGYNFNRNKIDWMSRRGQIKVSSGQMEFERAHLLRKLKVRHRTKYHEVRIVEKIKPHPVFRVVNGPVETWEVRT